MAKGNSTKAAQDAAPKETDTAQAPAATTDESTANAGEVVQTGAEGAQDNAPAAPAADESAAQPNPNEGNQPPAAPPAPETPLPESVTMAAPYGFINESTNEHHFWQAGQVVTDPADIKLLVERQAPLE